MVEKGGEKDLPKRREKKGERKEKLPLEKRFLGRREKP